MDAYLTNIEFHLMSEWTRKTHLDEVMDVVRKGTDDFAIWDYQNNKELTLKEGFAFFDSAIAYSFEHEGFNEIDSEVLYDLFIRMTGNDYRYLYQRDLDCNDIDR